MLIVHDPICVEYGSYLRPEQPARVVRTERQLRNAHPDWRWERPDAAKATDELLLGVHTRGHLRSLGFGKDFDADTPFFPGIGDHARRAVAGALTAAERAWSGVGPAFSLLRPPGHHATRTAAMGFCYLNQIAVAAVVMAAHPGVGRVAVWDFDAHHGNGTEAIVKGHEEILFASVHQSPGYPGTGLSDDGPRIRNWPLAPRTPREQHMAALRASWEAVLAFDPGLILVSAGFDAYARDPITAMTLEAEDFARLGAWLRESGRPAAAVLEGGYSEDLPLLVDAFLSAWDRKG
jgi:acetoin utilization deacetylase AcuC-like enzyme